MTTIITRSALVAWGRSPPHDLAYVIADHHGRRVVTWTEVMAERRERQRRCLELKRWSEVWYACKLWVAYFDQDLMGGWHAFLESRRWRVWIDRDRKMLISRLMELFPLVLPFAHEWDHWKEEFARQFSRRRQDGEPVGVVYLWSNGREVRP